MAKRRKLLQRSAQKPKPNSTQAAPKKKKPQQKQQQHHREEPVVPFHRRERILLVGEGDLSFAASIVRHHRCANVTATVLEKDRAELEAKYPSVEDNIAALESGPPSKEEEGEEDTDEAQDGEVEDDDEEERKKEEESGGEQHSANKLVFGIDATKLPASLSRRPFDCILFNFPHVGGKSTDVNRQVRYNQELLVSFFKSAQKALAPKGKIVVTLFEGEPYTLWNVKDLARHAELQVERSFRFQASIYPGYRHARTLGVVRNKHGEVGGGWKGEERPARSYVFRRKGEVPAVQPSKKKRTRDDDDSSSEED